MLRRRLHVRSKDCQPVDDFVDHRGVEVEMDEQRLGHVCYRPRRITSTTLTQSSMAANAVRGDRRRSGPPTLRFMADDSILWQRPPSSCQRHFNGQRPITLTNMTEPDLDHLIADLYDAAMAPGLWTDWLSSAANCFGGHTGMSVVQDGQSGAVDLLGAHNVSMQALQLYGEYYHKCDLWTQRSGKTLMKATISADLCTDEEYANSEIYVDFSKPHSGGQFYVVGAVLPVDRDIGVIGFQNPRDAGPFSRLHAAGLDRLLPHLQRALLIRARLQRAEVRGAASEAVLDSLNHGILLVSLDGAAVHANEVACRILENGDGLSLGRTGLLLGGRPAETNALRTLIAGCARLTGGGALSLRRPSGLRPLEVIVAPLARTVLSRLPARAGAIVFLRDPEALLQPVPEVLGAFYRLTPAEARLAADLLEHLTLEEIAARRRLSRETLRTQLRELFRKTGTNRQSELVGFLAAGLAATIRQRQPA